MARILVIDDDIDLRGVICSILESVGHDVIQADEGGDGLKQFLEGPADLVLTDLIMPGQEGVETIIELRKLYPDVPIVAMSGGGQGEPGQFLHLADKLGASGTLQKPFSRDLLLETIAKLLGSETF